MKNLRNLLAAFVVLLCFGCSEDDNTPPNPVIIEAVTNEVVFFNFIPDTGNTTSKLEYEIIFTNLNAFEIEGFSKITTNSDGLISSTISTSNSQCYTIAANSSSTYTFEAEDSHDLGMVNTVELVSVEYTIAE